MKKLPIILLFLIQAAALVLITCGREGPLPPADKTPPTVIKTVPTDGFKDYPIDGTITITFSKEMDTSTINAQTIILKDLNDSIQPTSVAYATNGTDYVAIVKPSQKLAQGMIYTVTISTSVRNIYGISMATPVTFFFITQTPLMVQSTAPANNAVNVVTNASIGLLFTKTVDPSTLTFNLSSTQTGTVGFTMDATLNPNISFRPLPTQQVPQGLLGNTTYTATISKGLRDYSGDIMQDDYVWSFTTGSDTDVTPPGVLTTDPANGDSNVSVYPYITITFTEAVRTSPTTTLTLYSAGSGTITCDRTDERGTQYIYDLPVTVEKLAYGTQYTATLTAGAQDLAGNAMEAPWSWKFTTALAPTQTTITAPAIAYGTDGSVTVSVYSSGTGTTPSGNVTLSVDGAATDKALANGSATFPIKAPSSGNHALIASYLTQGVFLASSATGTLSVSPGSSTTTSLQTSANPSTYGSMVTFTATVTSGATGLVTFLDGTTVLGTGTLSQGTPNTATFGISSLAVGNHTITAVYAGDANMPGSTSSPLTLNIVGGSSSTSLQQSSASSAYSASVTFTATVTSSGGIPAGSVTFLDGATTLGSATLSGTPNTAVYSTSSLGGGQHSITAVYNGSPSFGVSTSSAITHTITNAPTTTSITSSVNPATYGNAVTFTATVSPSTASGTVTFSDSGSALGTSTITGGTAQLSTSALTAGTHSITATFNPGTTYFAASSSTLSPSQVVNPIITASAGTGGSISPSGSVAVSYNASQTFTITPNTGYAISSVVADGTPVGAVSSYTFSNVTANHTLAVIFVLKTFNIAVSAGANGSITPPGPSVTVNYGANQTFTFTPNSGYYISAVTVDGSNAGLPTSYTFYNVTGPHTISVSFALGTNIITATAGAGGTITSGGTIVSSGTSQDFLVSNGGSRSFTTAPNTGYSITSILVDGVATTQNPYSFTNVTASHTISASFAINSYTVTPSAGANGSISPTTPQTVNYNGTTAFTVTPSPGYTAAMGGTCGGTLSGNTYTTNLITANCTVIASFSINAYTINATAGANGSISPSGAVGLNYGGSQTFTITANTGYSIASVVVDGISQTPAPSSYTFINVTANHTISASFSINTFAVTPSVSGGNGSISPTTPQTVNYNGTAAFTVTPSPGYTAVMGGTCGGTLSGNTYTTNPVIANCTVIASFSINTFTVTPSAGANGSISPNTPQTVNYNGTTSFTVTPLTGYTAAVGGTCGGTLNGNTYTTNPVTVNCTVTASFASNTFTVTPSVSGGNGNISPNTPQTVNYNGTTAFTVTPAPGYSAAVGGTCGGTLAGNIFTTNPVTANCTVIGSFLINTYTITTSAGIGGSISPVNPTVNYNGKVTITISPDTGYHVADVLVDSVSVGAVTSYTFTKVNDNHTIAATFTINTYMVTPSAGANGSISPSTPQTVNYNGTTSFTVTPNQGYSAAVGGTCGGSLNGNTYTTNPVTANCTVTASFAISTFTVTPSAGANGSISPNAPQTVNYNGATSFTVTPATGYSTVMGGTCGGTLVGNTYTTNPVTANCTVTAGFTINTYTVTASAGPNGTISPTGDVPVNYGATASFTVTPAAGYTALIGGTCGGTLNGDVFTTGSVTNNCTVIATFQ